MVKQKALKAFAYIRVSTEIQVEDGYSLDNQEYEIKEFLKKENMILSGIYKDAGRSGKNISGRPDFQRMLDDIDSGVEVDYVVVYSLSRFGRNAADVFQSLQILERNGVFLHCIKEKTDSAGTFGKAMLQLSSVFAELERNNIRETTRGGRYQKAREGKWNGAQAPFGYKLEEGKLIIDEKEADIVRIIFKKYTENKSGVQGIARWLNENGYQKEPRGNGKYVHFTPNSVKTIIDNPVYSGKIAYGRRQVQPKKGTDGEVHTVRQKVYQINDGIHDAIVSEEIFELAQIRRKSESRPFPRKRNDRVSMLTGLLICPVCGRKLVANTSRGKLKKDGTKGKDTHAYCCRYSKKAFGPDCTFRTQYRQELIDAEIDDVMKICLVDNIFAEMITFHCNEELDADGIRDEMRKLKKEKIQHDGAIRSLSERLDSLDVTDNSYNRKYDDMQARLDALYEKAEKVEYRIEESMRNLRNVQTKEMNAEDALNYLVYVGQTLKIVHPELKKKLYSAFIDYIEIYPDADWKHGEDIISKIKFKIPMMYGNERTYELSHLVNKNGKQTEKKIRMDEFFRDKKNTDECIALLQRVK